MNKHTVPGENNFVARPHMWWWWLLVVVMIVVLLRVKETFVVPALGDIYTDMLKSLKEYDTAELNMYRASAKRSWIFGKSSVPHALRLMSNPRAAPSAKKAVELQTRLREVAQAAYGTEDKLTAKQLSENAEDLRIQVQDALLTAMMVSTDPLRKVKLSQKVGRKSCATLTDLVDRSTKLQRGQYAVLAYLMAKGQEFVAHMLQKYPDDPLTKNLNAQWNREILPMSPRYAAKNNAYLASKGRYGCVVVNMALTRSMPATLSGLLHEFAHLCAKQGATEPHTPLFYATHRKLLRIATEDLGWTLETACRTACDWTGEDTCPKCYWHRDPAACSADIAKRPQVCRPAEKDVTNAS